MQYFYEEQLHRMECLSQEPVLFEDVLCQIHDMVQPAVEGIFTLQDLKRQKSLAGILFNILFNLNKFIAFETRDPFVVRQVTSGQPSLIDMPSADKPILLQSQPNMTTCKRAACSGKHQLNVSLRDIHSSFTSNSVCHIYSVLMINMVCRSEKTRH